MASILFVGEIILGKKNPGMNYLLPIKSNESKKNMVPGTMASFVYLFFSITVVTQAAMPVCTYEIRSTGILVGMFVYRCIILAVRI